MFVGWRELRFAKGRFVLMGGVVALIAALVGLLSGLTAGLGEENVSAITRLPVDRVAFGAPPDGGKPSFEDSTVTERQWRRWQRAHDVSGAEPLGISTTRAESGRHTVAISVFGSRPEAGLAPGGAQTKDGQVVLSCAAARELGAARPGDRVTVAGRPLTVTAIKGDDSYSHTPVLWTSLTDWRRLAPTGPEKQRPYATVIALHAGATAGTAAVDASAGTRTVTKGAAPAAIGSYTSENGSLQMMRGVLFAISALVIGAFFTVWTIQRSPDVAVLKALGASTRYLLRDALTQALALLSLGTAFGTAIAAGVGGLLGDSVPFVLAPSTVLLPAAVIVALGAAGAALAIRRITSVDPLTALGSAR